MDVRYGYGTDGIWYVPEDLQGEAVDLHPTLHAITEHVAGWLACVVIPLALWGIVFGLIWIMQRYI